MKRIELLRNEALNSPRFYDKFFYLFFKKYTESHSCEEIDKYSEAFYYAFTELKPIISDGELIVGKANTPLSVNEQYEWDNNLKAAAIQRFDKAGYGQDSHMAIDYELLLSKGIKGILDNINGYLANCSDDKKSFYYACKKCLEAVVIHSENYSKLAASLAETEVNETRRNELRKIAEVCKNVPLNPAKSFYEAVQSVQFVTYCLSFNPLRYGAFQQFQLGHPDRYLLKYYEEDIKNGEITKEYAQLLLDCLGIQINMRVPNGLSCGYMVGGRDKNGRVVANELTQMCMNVISDVRLVYPAVGLCYTDEMGDEYLTKSCEILATGASHPAIFNDDIITEGLKFYGIPENEAHDYIHSTCVEITPVAASNVWVASPYTNMAQLLLDCMDKEYTAFDELQNEIKSRLSQSIKKNFDEQNAIRHQREQNSVNPLLSCFVNDCLSLGLDIECGGARYNWIMPSFVGMGNLIDSLYAIKTLVFDNKELTLLEFKNIVDSNFESDEALRQRILNKISKYGNDDNEVDSLFNTYTDFIVDECKKHTPSHQNARLIPSVFCWIKHEIFGSETGATPDGRKAGFPLGDGSGPCQGREHNGPTASVLSSTKWSHKELIGGVAVNMKFSKKMMSESSVHNIVNIIKVFLNRGGFEMQINVVDKDTLLKARENPEAYRDLLVRIGGYSDYFVKLSPNMQNEVILRTEHEI